MAQSVQYTDITGEWIFEKNYKSDKATLDHCLIKNRYDNGTVFILAQNPAGEIRVALHFPHENLIPKKSYPVELLIDDQKILETTALVITPSILALPLPSSPELMGKIATGNSLTISGPEDMVQFTLKGTAKATKQLESCLDKTASKKEDFVHLPQWLKEILVKIDMSDIRTIEIDNSQNLPLDYAWVSPEIFGGVKIIPFSKENTTPDTIIPYYLSVVEKLCPGDFISEPGEKKRNQTTEFKPYDLVCSANNKDAITSLLFGIEENLVTVFFFESNANGKSLQKRNELLSILAP